MSHAPFITYLKQHISAGKTISTEELKTYYKAWKDKPVSSSSFRVIIHRMKKNGHLVSVKRGLYKMEGAGRFTIQTGEFEKSLFEILQANFPFAKIMVWNTAFFDRFSSLQSVKNRTVVGVSTGIEESVFAFLKNEFKNKVFLKPDEETYLNYVSEQEHPVIIKALVSESPDEEVEGVTVPTIEKIIVDLFADETDFLPWLAERATIIRELFDSTTVNLSTLMRYASRRNRKSFLIEWLIKHQMVKPELLEDL